MEGLAQGGETAVDLNKLPSVGDGKNFPTVDNMSGSGFESVKTKLGPTGAEFDAELTPSRINAYKNDFFNMTSDEGSMKAAQQLLDPRNADALAQLQQSGAWPRDLPFDADVNQVADAIKRGGFIVPDDAVAQVQNAVRSQVLLDPEAIGLPANPTVGQVDQVVGQVRPMGVTGTELNRILPVRPAPSPLP
jgi:hypothetical protein